MKLLPIISSIFALCLPLLASEEKIFNAIVPFPAEISSQSEKLIPKDKFKIKEILTPNGGEGYRLVCKNGEITIFGTYAGIFYAKKTLEQLDAFPQEFSISDSPRFSWRGLHFDESRHFFGKEQVKRLLDLMARYKLNRFHWHLCDGPGWRIEIKAFPKLTEIGAWRVDKTNLPWNWQSTEIPTSPQKDKTKLYGGFYTQEDIKEIVAYAKERFITIIPEIELPGHSYAALVSYPEILACPTNNVPVDGLRGKDVICAGKDTSFEFYKKVLDEVVALFPDSPIHIGADEVSKDAWKQCPLCKERMKKEGLKSYEELQSYFVQRIAKTLTERGIQVFGWDEVMDGGLPKGVGVTVWRSAEFAAKAARDWNAPTVMSPCHPCYFNFRNVKAKKGEPPAEDFSNSLSEVFAFNPVPAEIRGTPAEKNIWGVQANLWTEHIQTPAHVDYQLLPRLLALSEIAWSPLNARSYEAFLQCVGKNQIPALKKQGYHPREFSPNNLE